MIQRRTPEDRKLESRHALLNFRFQGEHPIFGNLYARRYILSFQIPCTTFPAQHLLYEMFLHNTSLCNVSCTTYYVHPFPVQSFLYNNFLYNITCTTFDVRQFLVQQFPVQHFLYNIVCTTFYSTMIYVQHFL